MTVRWVSVLAVMLALGGCASIPPAPPVQIRAEPENAWMLKGRLGVKTEEQSLSGQVHWTHHPRTDEILIISPLGQGVARIVRDATGVTLDVPNQPSRHAADAESLTQTVLGYALPVSGLVWWVQAQPAPGRAFEATRDAAGRIAQLRQDGWVIDYLQYAEEAPARPRKLLVARKGLEIRLVTDTWKAE